MGQAESLVNFIVCSSLSSVLPRFPTKVEKGLRPNTTARRLPSWLTLVPRTSCPAVFVRRTGLPVGTFLESREIVQRSDSLGAPFFRPNRTRLSGSQETTLPPPCTNSLSVSRIRASPPSRLRISRVPPEA